MTKIKVGKQVKLTRAVMLRNLKAKLTIGSNK